MTNINLYLIPPWEPVLDSDENLVVELKKELSSSHKLSGASYIPLARSMINDDVLFMCKKDSYEFYALVHLTWSGEEEKNSSYPSFDIFQSLEAFRKFIMVN